MKHYWIVITMTDGNIKYRAYGRRVSTADNIEKFSGEYTRSINIAGTSKAADEMIKAFNDSFKRNGEFWEV